MIKPLHDKVIIKIIETETVTSGGIHIPDQATEKQLRGIVVAVGNGRHLDNGKTAAMEAQEGDEVLFGKYLGTDIRIDGEDFLIVKEDDILACLESE